MTNNPICILSYPTTVIKFKINNKYIDTRWQECKVTFFCILAHHFMYWNLKIGSKMKWIEVKVYTASEAVEAVSAILLDLKAEG
ncbi:MAG: hypothetical protein LBI41_02675 [Lactobacillales bacterium]|nr:hypothetical protein [Lactobacillales bacterium]